MLRFETWLWLLALAAAALTYRLAFRLARHLALGDAHVPAPDQVLAPRH